MLKCISVEFFKYHDRLIAFVVAVALGVGVLNNSRVSPLIFLLESSF